MKDLSKNHGTDNQNGNAFSGLSRRDFLKVSVLGAGAAALPAVHIDEGSKDVAQSSAGAKAAFKVQKQTAPVNLANPPRVETWNEPWVWRPADFPGDRLQLNVIEHQSPSVLVGFGNPGAVLFAYNGATPGPTIRMQGDETLLLQVVNHLGLNNGRSPVGPAPDLAAYPPVAPGEPPRTYPDDVVLLPDWCLGEHTNGVHSVRTTNMHTHGLHVRPGRNPDGTHSDNIYLRVLPIPDLKQRESSDDCNFLRDLETVGQADFEFRLGKVQGNPDQPHPPGTHWYHPHAHGSTHNEVASGLAGFLVVEGDVDTYLNNELAGEPNPDPTQKTGPYDYRERLMLIQRVNPGNVSRDPDALAKRQQNPTIPATNGSPVPSLITMQPGAIERWRILNGSVDGKGYLRFMVLAGQWEHAAPPDAPENPQTLDEVIMSLPQLLRVEADGTRTVPTTEEIEAAKVHLYQLAMDGVTLVRGEGDSAEYYIKDLNFAADPNPLKQDFTNLADCYRDEQSLLACYNRPNEVYMGPANRTDLLFQAPVADDEQAQIYTVVAKATAIHTENLQHAIQLAQDDLAYAQAAAEEFPDVGLDKIIDDLNIVKGLGLPEDTIVAYVVVAAASDAQGIDAFEILELNGGFPNVPAYLLPINAEELLITDPDEAAAHNIDPDEYFRSRRITYSGWGPATWPRIHPENLVPYDPNGPEPGAINPIYLYDTAVDANIGELVMAPDVRTMAIDGRKFDPTDPTRPKMGLWTAEEWAVFNNTISLFGEFQQDNDIDFSVEDQRALSYALGIRNYQRNHAVGFPVTRAEADANDWKITTRGIDHPFHIHTNPVWVMRVEVPDQAGNLVNILDAPRWQDAVWLPRNGGRIVFRSRYPDYVGVLVNHCHILLHEDNGMMQAIEIVPKAEDANYVPVAVVAEPGMDAEEVNEIYPPDAPEETYMQCTRFIDPNQNPDRYQEYPAENGAFLPLYDY